MVSATPAQPQRRGAHDDRHPSPPDPCSDSSDSLLRFAMRADATLCAGTGLLDRLRRRPAVPAVGAVGRIRVDRRRRAGRSTASRSTCSRRRPVVRRIGVGIVVANVVFAIVALAVLAAGVLPLTGAGVAMMLATVAATLGFAYAPVPRSAPSGVTPCRTGARPPAARGYGVRPAPASLLHRPPNN